MDLIIKTETQTIAIVIKDNLRGFRLNQAGIVYFTYLMKTFRIYQKC